MGFRRADHPRPVGTIKVKKCSHRKIVRNRGCKLPLRGIFLRFLTVKLQGYLIEEETELLALVARRSDIGKASNETEATTRLFGQQLGQTLACCPSARMARRAYEPARRAWPARPANQAQQVGSLV